jgi:hypothetical protein
VENPVPTRAGLRLRPTESLRKEHSAVGGCERNVEPFCPSEFHLFQALIPTQTSRLLARFRDARLLRVDYGAPVCAIAGLKPV